MNYRLLRRIALTALAFFAIPLFWLFLDFIYYLIGPYMYPLFGLCLCCGFAYFAWIISK